MSAALPYTFRKNVTRVRDAEVVYILHKSGFIISISEIKQIKISSNY
jgi:hypothetical protein